MDLTKVWDVVGGKKASALVGVIGLVTAGTLAWHPYGWFAIAAYFLGQGLSDFGKGDKK